MSWPEDFDQVLRRRQEARSTLDRLVGLQRRLDRQMREAQKNLESLDSEMVQALTDRMTTLGGDV